MIVLDVNVLVAAFRGEHPHHLPVRSWLGQALHDEDAVVVPDLSWVGFLRITTNNRVFEVPATLEQAVAFMAAVTGNAGYRPDPGLFGEWTGFVDLASEARVTGNLVPDAYLAAIALGLACPIATMDRDFRRFPGLKIIDPAA